MYRVVAFSSPLGLWGSTLNWKLSIAQPMARRREGCHIFKLWTVYFQRIHFIDYLNITTAVVVPCGDPKSLPVHRCSEGCRICHYLSWTDSIRTESAVFKLWTLYFQRIHLTDYLEITTAVVVSPYSYFFTLSGPLGLKGSTLLFGSRVALNPGLGGVSDVASAVISHEQTQ